MEIIGYILNVPTVLCTVSFLWIYWYLTKDFNFWKKRNVKYIKPVPLFGNIMDRVLFRTSFHEFQLGLYRKFEGLKFAGVFEGRRPVLMVRDPDIIKSIMVRDFEHFVDRPTLTFRTKAYYNNMLISLKGQLWKNVRTILTPTFSSGKLKMMEILIEKCGHQLVQYVNSYVTIQGKTEVEMKDFFGRYTLDVIATCAFGVDCNSLQHPDSEFIKKASRFNQLGILRRITLFIVILVEPALSKYIPLSFFNDEAMEFLRDVVLEIAEYRQKNMEAKRLDFLQLMLDAAQKEEEESKNNKVKAVLNNDVMTAQSLLFLIAGYETTSTLLTFTSYMLALNPEIQEKTRSEIMSVLKKYDNVCSYDAVQDMVFLENVLLETLRLHPPIGSVDRLCTKTYAVPGGGFELPKGYTVSIPIMGLHYDEEYYPNPEVFEPNRFSSEEKSKRSPYVFLPFGSGPRNCIGARFAILTAKIAMLYLLKNFRLKLSTKTQVPVKYSRKTMFLSTDSGVWLKIEKISDS